MKRFAVFVLVAALFAGGCHRATEDQKKEKTMDAGALKAEITSLEKQLFGSNATTVDLVKTNLLINKYTLYANSFPEDSLSPEFLFKASDLSMNANKPGKTIALYNRIIKDYPHYKNVSTCYFLKGFVYDEQLKEYDKAKKYYRLYLDKFPDGEFADDARMALKYLGKSPEELIKLFEEENKKSN